MSFKREGDDHSWLNVLNKRRVAELFAVDIPEDEAHLMKNGRFACLVCDNRPVFDTVSMLAVHRSGKKHLAYAEEFWSKKSELNDLRLKRRHELYAKNGEKMPPRSDLQTSSGSGTSDLSARQTHPLLGSCMYDSRCKRRKNLPTDRRRVVDLDTPSNFPAEIELLSSAANSSGSLTETPCEKPPQTIADIRKFKERQMEKERETVRPYAGKRTVSQRIQDCCSSSESKSCGKTGNSAAQIRLSYEMSVASVSTSNFSSCTATKLQKTDDCRCPTSPALATKSDAYCHRPDQTDRITGYLKAIGSGWKKSRDGSWIKDEAAEFESDEEPPDVV